MVAAKDWSEANQQGIGSLPKQASAYPTALIAAVGIQSSSQLHHDSQPILWTWIHHLDLWMVERVARICHCKSCLPHADADEGIPACTAQQKVLPRSNSQLVSSPIASRQMQNSALSCFTRLQTSSILNKTLKVCPLSINCWVCCCKSLFRGETTMIVCLATPKVLTSGV